MKPFFWKIVICLVPNLLAGWGVWHATDQYLAGEEGGFKLGVDLVGGTILVYEIDETKTNLSKNLRGAADDKSKDLAGYLKRRIDPNDLYNIVVRSVGDGSRVEIILPTGGKFRSERAHAAWNILLDKVKKKWGARIGNHQEIFDVPQGKVEELAERIKRAVQEELWPKLLEKKPIWDKFKKVAKEWQVPDDVLGDKPGQIKPGDYLALLNRLQNYQNAVREINKLALDEAWKETLDRLQKNKKYFPRDEVDLNAFGPNDRLDLIRFIQAKGNPLTKELLMAADTVVGQPLTPKGAPSSQELEAFIDDTFGPSADTVLASIKGYYTENRQRDITEEYIQNVKGLIAKVGLLEFLILANNRDDQEGATDAEKELQVLEKDNKLDDLAKQGHAPPGPRKPDGYTIRTARGQVSRVNYSWIPLHNSYRKTLRLSNVYESPATPGRDNWVLAEQARNRKPVQIARIPEANGNLFIYSRRCVNQNLPEEERKKIKYEYFILVRDPEIDTTGEFVGKNQPKRITGEYLSGVSAGQSGGEGPEVLFQFNNQGARLFRDLTSKNVPDEGQGGGRFLRHLAIVLDGEIRTAPTINSVIEDSGRITGSFTTKEVNDYVAILRAGALPATLKRQPVSENTMGATLGEDTIEKGVWSVAIAFVCILVFMAVYYRFAGLVACTALLSNLLLTVGFMVAVQATFTLPGLAGLVLMIGMAVDANVLIYERLREERDRGASLALALRNGYDRAFPTIIDTHLSSIFTAIVLYVVGNDQLKGFGVSLTVGLIISLFTSLYMTRLIFDIWLNRGWLKKLSMLRLFSRPNIDFMGIRYYWFTATILLTVAGVSVFLARGEQGLNIDFVGGTAYTGQLQKPRDLEELRTYFSEANKAERLKINPDGVKEIDDKGHLYQITFAVALGPDQTRTVYIDNPQGKTAAEREADVRAHAQDALPDQSLYPEFLPSDEKAKKAGEGKSSFFTIRTVNKEVQLVQAAVDRLLRSPDGQSLLEKNYLTFTPIIPPPAQGKSPLVKEALIQFWTKPMSEKDLTEPADKATKEKWENDLEKYRAYDSPSYLTTLVNEVVLRDLKLSESKDQKKYLPNLTGKGTSKDGRYRKMIATFPDPGLSPSQLKEIGKHAQEAFDERPPAERLENIDRTLAKDTQGRAILAIVLSWGAILLYLWFRFGSWTFGLAAVLCLIHDLFFTLGIIAFASYLQGTAVGNFLLLEDFKLDLNGVAALLTLVGYSVNDTIVVFDRIREVRGKNPDLTPQMINDSVNQTLSRTLLTSFATWLVVIVLYIFGGQGVHLFAFIMVVGVIVGTYSSIYIASPLLLIFGEGHKSTARYRDRQTRPVPAPAT